MQNRNKIIFTFLFVLFGLLFFMSTKSSAYVYEVDEDVSINFAGEGSISSRFHNYPYRLFFSNDYDNSAYLIECDAPFSLRGATEEEFYSSTVSSVNRRYPLVLSFESIDSVVNLATHRCTGFTYNEATKTYTVSAVYNGSGGLTSAISGTNYCYFSWYYVSGETDYSPIDVAKLNKLAGNARFFDTSTGGSGSDNEGDSSGGGTEGDSGDTSDSDNNYSWFDFLKEGIATIINGIVSFLSWLNPFSDDFILKGVLEFLGNILDFLNPFSDNFILLKLWDFLVTIISYINPFSDNFFGYKLISLLGDLLKMLFVPSEERITALTDTVSAKFGFVETIKTSITSLQDVINNVGSAPKLNINIGATKYSNAGTVAIDFSFYNPFKPYGDLVITGFVYATYIWRLFIKLPSIINGLSGSTEVSDGNVTIVSKGGNGK